MPPVRSRDRLAPFRAEVLSEALAICRDQPAGDLRRPRIAHLRAVIALLHGQVDLAIAYLSHAIRLDAACASPFVDLGEAMLRKGRPMDALSAHLCALIRAPRDPERYCRISRDLLRQHRYVEARVMCQEALNLAPDDVDVHVTIGDVLTAQGRTREALSSFLKASELAPDDAEAVLRIGAARLALGEWAEALTTFRHALTLQSGSGESHVGAGQALMRLGRLEEAEQAFYSALCIDPRNVSANQQHVLVTELQGRRADAVDGWICLGYALETKRRFQESAATYREAVARKPSSIRARVGLARAAMGRGEATEAVRQLEAALEVDPEHAQVHTELGLVLQQAGQFERSWDELAWYHLPSSPTWRHLEQPVWDGSPLDGRTVLLWADEEAVDDHIIHFLRHGNHARSSGGKVIVECPPSLVPVVRPVQEPDHHVVATGGPLPPYDLHAPLSHLPSLVKPARATLHAAPYLAPPEELAAAWRRRLSRGAAPLIGIAWAGSLDLHEAPSQPASLSAFAPLRDLPEIRLISLQRGPHRHELLAPPAGLKVESCLPDFCSIAEVAAVVVNLDVVITVASPLAHLAGALGKPVWTLLWQGAGWPWPVRGDEMPGYPTMRLFRQERPGDWSASLENVRAALTAALGNTHDGANTSERMTV